MRIASTHGSSILHSKAGITAAISPKAFFFLFLFQIQIRVLVGAGKNSAPLFILFYRPVKMDIRCS
jgi:hypothetical protein